jgi:hypothetical protein
MVSEFQCLFKQYNEKNSGGAIESTEFRGDFFRDFLAILKFHFDSASHCKEISHDSMLLRNGASLLCEAMLFF